VGQVKAARSRRIPILRLMPTGSLVQLGYGLYQKRIRASETSHTSKIAVEMCQEKSLANSMLRAVGVPVPDGHIVRSADEAWAASQEVGLPVVVKPKAGNQGKGVSANLSSAADIHAAYTIAAVYHDNVLVVYHDGFDGQVFLLYSRLKTGGLHGQEVLCDVNG
jgi:cyanophycin synthetase